MNAEQTIDAAKNSLQRIQKYLERFEVGKGYCKECVHSFIDKDGDEIPLLVADLKVLLQQVTTTSTNTDTPVVPQGWKLVQIELLERIRESLGSYLSDHGWSQSDMDAADALDGLLAAVPQPPACNQSMQPELAAYSAQARNKKGIEQ